MKRIVVAIACACGGSSGPPPAPSVALPVSLVAPANGPEDLQVATVNGRPVWGSCVEHQVLRGAKDRRAALDECVAFELMAQAAEQRGLARDPWVIDATRTAMVSELVATFEDAHATPASLGATLDRLLDANAWRMHRPELRGSTYVRVPLPKEASPEQEAKARAVIDQVAAALANERGMTAPLVRDLVRPLVDGAGVDVEIKDVPVDDGRRWDRAYRDALWCIAEVGRAARPARTMFGWDVVVWTSVIEPKESTREELAQDAFPDVRRQVFTQWVNQIIRDRGIQIRVDPTGLEEDGG